MDVNIRQIQQLLRPTDTCIFVAQGYLLGLSHPAQRQFAVIKHETKEEYALFLFTKDLIDTPPVLAVDAIFSIRGSFHAAVKAPEYGRCQVLLDTGQGSSLLLDLPYEQHTAVFIAQLNKALQHFTNSSSVNSSAAFDWLKGYELCHTGWDRYTRPHRLGNHVSRERSPPPLIDLSGAKGGREGERSEKEPLQVAFPETWPWSHIITPKPDCTTEVAKCETLLMDFDPLLQSHASSSAVAISAPTTIPQRSEDDDTYDLGPHLEVISATPQSSPLFPASTEFFAPPPPSQLLPPSTDYFPLSADGEQVSGESSPSPPNSDPGQLQGQDMRHCISDSNLLRLDHGMRSIDRSSPLFTRSQEDLTDSHMLSHRHCVAMTASRESLSDSVDVDPATCKLHMGSKDNGKVGVSHLQRGLAESHLAAVSEGSLDRTPALQETEDVLDYKARRGRRSRSTETSPKLSNKRLDFLTPSGSKPRASHAAFNSPELSSQKSGRSRDRSVSRPSVHVPLPPNHSGTAWVSRYRPGVAVPMGTARESIVQAELRCREKEFCSSRQLRMFVGTWNVNGRPPPANLDPFLLQYQAKDEVGVPPPEVYAIGLQEMDLSTQCLVSGESKLEEPWIDTVEATLRKIATYHRVCVIRMVGVILMVYVLDELKAFVSEVETELVQTGVLGVVGNKGGVGVHFNLFHTSVCFVNSHLSAHMELVDRRNQDYHTIMNKMVFDKVAADYKYSIMDHDLVFWLGDLNYRLQTSPEMTMEMIRAHADTYQIHSLLTLDQLHQEMFKEAAFSVFIEGIIDFKPTYKYDINSDNWDSSEKHRAPAWCDRVLYNGSDLELLAYRSHPELRSSDHKPVSAVFSARARVVIPEQEREVLEQITWKLDKLENDTLPQVDLNTTEFLFGEVRFLVPYVRRLVVTNTGSRPVHVCFIPKLTDKQFSKPWLTAKPSSAVLRPLEDVMVQLKVLVDEDTAPLLNSGKDQLEDILILHLERGKDFFISLSGSYQPSCFGSSLDALVHIHTYIREVSVEQLIDLSCSWEQCDTNPTPRPAPPPLDIPKELFRMVGHLRKYGLDTDGIFTESGMQSEFDEIRTMLDGGGGRELPGSPLSVASALLTFLAALAEPVIPTTLHQRCMDASNNATLCKQILRQMPKLHARVFVFLLTFMKKLLKHSDTNGLEPKVLATIFGEVLLRSPLAERKGRSKRALASMNRKKATFIYQFLVNDLTIEYQ